MGLHVQWTVQCAWSHQAEWVLIVERDNRKKEVELEEGVIWIRWNNIRKERKKVREADRQTDRQTNK